MRSQHIAMTIDEYHLLPNKPGWKCEYYEGKAHLTPRHNVTFLKVAVTPRPVEPSFILRGVTQEDTEALTAAFYEAFADSYEFCDWTPRQIRETAAQSMADYFLGKRGSPMDASRVAVRTSRTGGTEELIGAALLIHSEYGPYLNPLFVRPRWQQRGLATALVSSAVNGLYTAGEKTLLSACHIGNEASLAWHHRFGFVEEPDMQLARLRLRYFYHELARRETLNNLTHSERGELETSVQFWKAEVKRLQEIEEYDGFEAVAPILRYGGL